jgi:hypothetical protein
LSNQSKATRLAMGNRNYDMQEVKSLTGLPINMAATPNSITGARLTDKVIQMLSLLPAAFIRLPF